MEMSKILRLYVVARVRNDIQYCAETNALFAASLLRGRGSIAQPGGATPLITRKCFFSFFALRLLSRLGSTPRVLPWNGKVHILVARRDDF